MTGRLGIDDVTPAVGGGRHPGKAVVGEVLPIGATVWREGHDAVAANVVWQQGRQPRPGAPRPHGAHAASGTDRFEAVVVADEPGLWTFRVDAWSDPWATWRNAVTKKLDAGQSPEELANDLEIGARLLQRVGRRPAERPNRDLLFGAANALRDTALPLHARVAPALFPAVQTIMTERPVRELITRGRPQQVYVDRARALFGSWYEFFPRSTGGARRDRPRRARHVRHRGQAARPRRRHGLRRRLPAARSTRSARCTARAATTPSSPGRATSARRGPSARPRAGTTRSTPSWARWRTSTRSSTRTTTSAWRSRSTSRCSARPTTRGSAEHPEWFTVRPDGTIAYAENPPKKYQDIYPVNFDNDPEGIYAESLRVVLHWVEHGVRIFRVDNPHTKPPNFWHWLIWQVKARYPDVLFLAEAFTRPGPAVRAGPARLHPVATPTSPGARRRQELTEFALMHAERADEARPNLFVNTPDILHESLQHGGRGMFAIRATLAATMSPTWGVYSGFELYEGEAVRPGSEEYLNSEKYELRPRDFEAAAATRRLAGALHHPAQRDPPRAPGAAAAARHRASTTSTTTRSSPTRKTDPATGDTVLMVVSPWTRGTPQEGTTALDLPALGLDWGDRLHRARRGHRRHLRTGASSTTCGWSPGTTWRTSSASCADHRPPSRLVDPTAASAPGGAEFRPARGGGPNSVIDQVREALGAASTDRSTAPDPTGNGMISA